MADAETNGKPELEQILPATDAERRGILDRYRATTRPGPPSTQICFDIGCWDPARETFEEFVARKLRA